MFFLIFQKKEKNIINRHYKNESRNGLNTPFIKRMKVVSAFVNLNDIIHSARSGS